METSISVLIIEDNPDQLELTRLRLKKSDPAIIIIETTSAHEALDLLQRETVHVILLDYSLPHMNGLELLQEIRRLNRRIPVIFVTGQGDEKIAVQAMKNGAYDYIIKEGNYLQHLHTIIRNAYEKEKLERQLQLSHTRYQNLFQSALDGIFIIDVDRFSIIDTNKKAQELTGRGAQELTGEALTGLCLPEDSGKLHAALTAAREKGSHLLDAIRMQHADGHIWDAEVAISILPGEGVTAMQCILRDVTEKRHMQKQILRSKLRLQALFDGIQDMISVQDDQFNIVMVNKNFARWRGTSPDALIGQKCHQAYFGRDRVCEGCPLIKTFARGEDDFLQMTFRDDILHLWSYPMESLSGEPKYAIEQIRIVTEQKKLEEQLIQSDKLVTVGILSSGIAHELRNPLNIIEAARYYLADTIPAEQEDIHNKLSIIRKNVHRSARIINNLLEFSRRRDVEVEEVDINYILDTTLALVEKELRVRSIKVRRKFGNALVGEYNPDSIRQLFLNLIMNAMQAMPDGGELKIRSYLDAEGWLRVEFEDCGEGISQENLKNIFAPFFTTKPVGQGTGLGLYIANAVVMRHGGRLEVESEVGVGSKFTVVLPLKPATATGSPGPQRLPGQRKKSEYAST